MGPRSAADRSPGLAGPQAPPRLGRGSELDGGARIVVRLADGVGEAIRSGRSDLVPVLISQAEGSVRADDETLGEVLEKIVLHSFEPVPGDEGESCASPHSKRALETIDTLRRMYGVPADPHALSS